MSLAKIQSRPAIAAALLKRHTKVGVLVDENTERHCYPQIKEKLGPHCIIRVASGEQHKTLNTCASIWDQLTQLKFDRHSILIIVGGGVLGDMGGFCAATYKRGIDFMLLPTTLLAQVDSSIGGKLGIDFGTYKNHIGVFQQPVATLIFTDFLETLPRRELRSGFAEVIKHCLISDKRMWNVIRKKTLDQQPWTTLVRHSVAFKDRVTKKDPKEKGLRKILNFGHSIGHALEGHYLHSTSSLLHGEAIAAGMVLEAAVAARKKLIQQPELTEIAAFIHSIYGKINLPDMEVLVSIMAQDKKNKGNKILLALPKGIGKAVWDVPVSETEVRHAMEFYQSL